MPNFIWPVAAGRPAVSQGFHSGHGGIDIQNYPHNSYPGWNALPISNDTPADRDNRGATRTGNPVIAAMSGVVAHRFARHESAGNGFVIAHGGGYFTRYLHLHNDNFETFTRGTTVSQGQRLGLTGQTGTVFSEGHLHFDIIYVENRRDFTAHEDAMLFTNPWFSSHRTGTERRVNTGANHTYWKHNPAHYLPQLVNDTARWPNDRGNHHNYLRN